ncbi:MAG: M24 family metallopeptidase [Actinomycetota bacterium]
MRRERHAKLQHQLDVQHLDGLLLLGTANVAYATGAAAPAVDSARAAYLRPVAVIRLDEPVAHLFTPYPDGAPPDVEAHGPLYPDLDDGATAMAGLFGPGQRVAADEVTHPMLRAMAGVDFVPASGVLGPAKLCKTPDELACIGAAQRINELAMADVIPMLRPGVRQIDLTARFLRRIFELGADANGIDPIWQVMPPRKADGPWTTHGDIAFPTPSTDRSLEEGDVIWVDSGVHVEGYASDFGRTWLCAADPTPSAQQQAQATRWRAVVDAVVALCKPGVSALELCRAAIAANDGIKPWIEHFYLAHGVGTDSAEMPLIGTDLGEAFDEQLVLEPGMVLVLEPVIWDDGAAGYRSEDIVAITDDGWMPLSDHPYDPFVAA